MNSISNIFQGIQLLFQHRPKKLALVFVLTLFQGISSGISIVLLIPLLQLIGNNNSQNQGRLADYIQTISDKTGLVLTVENILFMYVILLITMAFINYWSSLINSKYQLSFIYNFRHRLYRKIIMADWFILNNKSKTNHLQVLTNEIPNLSGFFFFLIRLAIQVIMTISYLVFAILISVKFTLLITFAGILLLFLLRKFLFKAFWLGEKQVENYNRLLKYIDDFWQTIKIAKVHNSERYYYNKFNDASSSLLELEYKMERNYSLPNLIFRISGILVLVIVIYFGYRVEQVPITSFFVLIILFARVYPMFTGINTNINMIFSNLASLKLVLKLDNEFQEKDFNVYHPQKQITLSQNIAIKNLSFSYNEKEKIIQNLNANIPARQITGITGDSGRGKTSFIDLIAGLQTPTSGIITIDKQELNNTIIPSWRNGIGYLPQDTFFIDGTIRENLVWDSNGSISDHKIWEILKQVNAEHLVSRFTNGLDNFVANYQFHFSGGERQRLALARVLLRYPRILILDEATSSLDIENEKLIMEVLSRLKEKVTIIFVSHRTSLLPWFDNIINIQ